MKLWDEYASKCIRLYHSDEIDAIYTEKVCLTELEFNTLVERVKKEAMQEYLNQHCGACKEPPSAYDLSSHNGIQRKK